MARQLALIETRDKEWRLDEETRETGREGVRQAREALRRALEHPQQHQPAA
jgi:hypothetical protein